jgi:hypothetical protein
MLFQYVGSFQDRRYVFRVGDQRAAVWREVERVGTIESLNRAAARTGADSKAAMLGSLRIRQAVELQRAAANTSQLTRPLLLYYSCLNLIRGMLSVQSGGMGKPRHGAAFKSAGSLLDCGAKLDKDGEGTIPRLVQLYGGNSKDLAGLEVSLQDCLAEIPELKRDFTLIPGSVSNVAWVEVKALIRGPTYLQFRIQNCSEEEFATSWQSFLPWMVDECELSSEEPYVLKLKQDGLDSAQVAEFCARRLMSKLHLSDDSVWFDQVKREGKYLFPGRLPPYVIALFILSNVCRYEPQLFGDTFNNSTDLGFVITSFLNCAERYVPQIFVGDMYGGTVFFE